MRIEIDPALTESLSALSATHESVRLEIQTRGYRIILEFLNGAWERGGIERLALIGQTLPTDGYMESADPMVIVINEGLNG